MAITPGILEQVATAMGMKPRIPQPPFGIIGNQDRCGTRVPCICSYCASGMVTRSDAEIGPAQLLSVDPEIVARHNGYVSVALMNPNDLAAHIAATERSNTNLIARHRASARARQLLLSLLNSGQRATWESHRTFWTLSSEGDWWLIGWNGFGRYKADGQYKQLHSCVWFGYADSLGRVQRLNRHDEIVALKLAVETDAASFRKLPGQNMRWDAGGVVAHYF